MAARKRSAQTLVIPPQRVERIPIIIGGADMLVTHRFSQKARQEIRDKQAQKAQTKKQARNPHAEYIESKYIDQDKYWDGLPCAAIRRAIIDAASFVDGVTKVHLRGAVFIEAQGKDMDLLNIIPIHAQREEMREDVVRLPTGSADLRYRAAYYNWGCKFTVKLDPDILNPEQLMHLVQRAGFSIGLCEARPQKSGDWGQFDIITEAQFRKLKPMKTPKADVQSAMRALRRDAEAA
jgi:hypothetical protein